eukprot:3132-Heterococcus_DN1.PRE.2
MYAQCTDTNDPYGMYTLYKVEACDRDPSMGKRSSIAAVWCWWCCCRLHCLLVAQHKPNNTMAFLKTYSNAKHRATRSDSSMNLVFVCTVHFTLFIACYQLLAQCLLKP